MILSKKSYLKYSYLRYYFLSLSLLVIFNISVYASNQQAYKVGEKLKFKLYYSSAMTGNVRAGSMTSIVKKDSNTSKQLNQYHFILDGETKGAFRWFFKAHDKYESIIDATTSFPNYYSEWKKEGSYFANMQVYFNQDKGEIKTINKKNNDTRNYNTPLRVHDLLSSLYFIRNWDFTKAKINQSYSISLFMDDSVYQIKFKVIGRELIHTSLGAIKTIKLAPHVITGGVFADETPMVIYLSDDKNHLPILAESKLMIGKARIELTEYSQLKYPLQRQ